MKTDIETSFQYYESNMPAVNELTIGTVIEYDEKIGFTMTLDEYSDHTSLLPLCNLARKSTWKQIKSLSIGSKHPVIVTFINNDVIDLSLMDVSPREHDDYLLYNQLSIQLLYSFKHLSKLSGCGVMELYKNIAWNNWEKNYADLDTHLFNKLSIRENIDNLSVEEKYKDLLKEHHIALFGIHTVKVVKKVKLISFDPDGSNCIINAFLSAQKEFKTDKTHSNEELYYNHDYCNVEYRPTAIPIYDIICVSCSKITAENLANNIAKFLISNINSNGKGEII